MKHTVIYKRDGWYTPFPQISHLPDGRVAVGAPSSPYHDHFGIADWVVLVSDDQGDNWTKTDDPSIPLNWPGASTREIEDRFAGVMSDGSYLCAGGTGWEIWPVECRLEAEDKGLHIREHPTDDDLMVIGGHKLFVQRSVDGGKTWTRQEWEGFSGVSFSRPAVLEDGTVLVPCYGGGHTYAWRSSDYGETFRLVPMEGHGIEGYVGDESAFVEVSRGRVLAHSRTETTGFLIERWSEDGGLTWSHPLSTGIWGYPPHLLTLADGRIVCVYGYRRPPMGIRAAVSEDGGKTWDLDGIRVLRDDGGNPGQCLSREQVRPDPARAGSDLGYPLSTQLADGSILTVYYITLADGITHVACTRWEA